MKKKWLINRLVLVSLGFAPQGVSAQGYVGTPLVAVPAAEVSAQAAGEPSALAIALFLAVTSMVLVAIIKANEVRASREEQAAALESAISGALFEIPGLVRSSAAPTVRLPRWRRGPARIALSGEVPSPYLAQVALRVAAHAASRIYPRFSLENRMTVTPEPARPAASQHSFRLQAEVTRKERAPWKTASQLR